jgi:DNA-binding HxlR family transcriptional regulator
VSAPRPGRPVRGSRTGRPIMAALDLLGRRWTLRVLWELRDGTPATFRALRTRCDEMSTSVLNQRLAELRAADIVESGDGGYELTKRGAELLTAMAPLDAWAKRWDASPQRKGSRGIPPKGAERTPSPEG